MPHIYPRHVPVGLLLCYYGGVCGLQKDLTQSYLGTSSCRSLLSRYREQNSGQYRGINFQLDIFNSKHYKPCKFSEIT